MQVAVEESVALPANVVTEILEMFGMDVSKRLLEMMGSKVPHLHEYGKESRSRGTPKEDIYLLQYCASGKHPALLPVRLTRKQPFPSSLTSNIDVNHWREWDQNSYDEYCRAYGRREKEKKAKKEKKEKVVAKKNPAQGTLDRFIF